MFRICVQDLNKKLTLEEEEEEEEEGSSTGGFHLNLNTN